MEASSAAGRRWGGGRPWEATDRAPPPTEPDVREREPEREEELLLELLATFTSSTRLFRSEIRPERDMNIL